MAGAEGTRTNGGVLKTIFGASFGLVLLTLAGLFVANAFAASPGTLVQLPGTQGCINDPPPADQGCDSGVAMKQATGTAVSPDGRNVYVVAQTSDSIAILDRDISTGAVDQKPGLAGCVSNDGGPAAACVDGRALSDPFDVAISPDGENVYVASGSSDGVAIFDRNPATGALTQPAGAAGCITMSGADDCANGRALDIPFDVTVSPDGGQVYATAANLPSSGVAVLDRAADGSLSQATNDSGCITEDGSGGPAEPDPCLDGHDLDGSRDLVVSGDGANVYVAAPNDSGAVAILDRLPNGDLTQDSGLNGCISSSGSPACVSAIGISAPGQLAIAPNDDYLYVLGPGGFPAADTVGILDRAANGDLSQRGGAGACIEDEDRPETSCIDVRAIDDAGALAVSPDGKTLYIGGVSGIAIFDVLADGGLSQPNGTGGCLISAQPSADGCAPARLVETVRDFAFDSAGANLYSADGTGGNGIAVFKREAGPTCSDLQRAVPNSTPRTIALACSDPNGDQLAYTIVSGPTHGTLEPVDANGNVTYTPEVGYIGPDSFTYRASAAGVDSNVATVTLDVLPAEAGDPPFAAFAEKKTTVKERRPFKIGFLSSEPGSAELQIRKGSKGVVDLTTAAQRGRNAFRLTKRLSRKLEKGSYSLALTLTDADNQQAGDGARLKVKKEKKGS